MGVQLRGTRACRPTSVLRGHPRVLTSAMAGDLRQLINETHCDHCILTRLPNGWQSIMIGQYRPLVLDSWR